MPILAVGLGLLVGVSLGALGAGGSILTVPVLVYLLGQDPYTATTSSLLIVGATSLIALLPHARRHRVRVAEGLLFGALGTAGSVAGARLSALVDPQLLLLAFAALMLVVAGLMLRRSRAHSQLAARAGFPRGGRVFDIHLLRCGCRRAAKLVVAATAVGLLTGFFGVGGGFALVPALVLVLYYPMPVAVGTSLLVIAVNSATAFLARLGPGTAYLDWAMLSAFTVVTVAGSLLGARLASRTHPQLLERVFGVVLVLVGLYTGAHGVLMLVAR